MDCGIVSRLLWRVPLVRVFFLVFKVLVRNMAAFPLTFGGGAPGPGGTEMLRRADPKDLRGEDRRLFISDSNTQDSY